MLKVENLAVAYGDFQVLWGVSLSVGKGEVVCLLGPNGAGKSTILNTVSGLLTKKEGSISFDAASTACLLTRSWSSVFLTSWSDAGSSHT
jgi:ABC-type branched-subunit amino acid transport system ATPase component